MYRKKIEEIILTISKGYPMAIASKKTYQGNAIDNLNKTYLKMLNLQNIRELIENKEVSYSYIEFEPKYQKEILYVEKNDIVITVASGKGIFNIMYIENEPNDKYVYNNSCLVVRINEDIISSKYVYIQLMTKHIQEQLLKMAKGTTIKHITKKDLLNIEIPILEEKETKQICSEYDKLKKAEMQLKEEQQEFWNTLNNQCQKIK